MAHPRGVKYIGGLNSYNGFCKNPFHTSEIAREPEIAIQETPTENNVENEDLPHNYVRPTVPANTNRTHDDVEKSIISRRVDTAETEDGEYPKAGA